ncbi:hypothetical protein [Caldithrix abyssi]
MKNIIFCTSVLLMVMAGAGLAQDVNPTIDYKVHNVGAFRQVVTNTGALWRQQSRYPGLIYCEFPLGSSEEHLGEAGFALAAIVKGDTLVTSSDSWDEADEMYPTDAPWDTIWVVKRGQRVDIGDPDDPYWPDYVGISDQDFVCKYSDDFYTKITGHRPMHIECIQRSMVWSFAPFNEFLILQFWITSKVDTLEEAYFAWFCDGNVGERLPGWDFALDDFSWYDETKDVAFAQDAEGGVDGLAYSPIAYKIFPPDNGGQIKTTFLWYSGWGEIASNHQELYRRLSSGEIKRNQVIPVGSQFWLTKGPYTILPGDTLLFTVVQLLGNGVKGIYKNLELAEWLINKNFAVPSPPPNPPLQVKADNHKVILTWKPDAENYHDPNRGDNVEHPFEGYRIYKSTQGYGGPWTLLAQFDKEDNFYGPNTGLKHEFIDEGLLNNFTYYYSVTSFSLPDTVLGITELESSLQENIVEVSPGPAPPETVGKVAVVPNPYLGNEDYTSYNPPWESPPPGRVWMEQDRKVQFINLPQRCTIQIFTLSGELVKVLEHNDPKRGYEEWNLVSQVGQAIASDVYLFVVKDLNNGNVQVGKFVVIK